MIFNVVMVLLITSAHCLAAEEPEETLEQVLKRIEDSINDDDIFDLKTINSFNFFDLIIDLEVLFQNNLQRKSVEGDGAYDVFALKTVPEIVVLKIKKKRKRGEVESLQEEVAYIQTLPAKSTQPRLKERLLKRQKQKEKTEAAQQESPTELRLILQQILLERIAKKNQE